MSASSAGGTVTRVTAGTGLSGGNITLEGTINLNPATASTLGGIKVGANLIISNDGTLSAYPPNVGTINQVIPSNGITGGGVGPVVSLSLSPATNSTVGGVIVGSGIDVAGGLISLASASEAQIGGVRFASSAEVITGTDNTKAITSAGLAAKVASTTQRGITQLSDSVTDNLSNIAATSKAVKTAYDLASTANTLAGNALPKSGGILTGTITFAPTQTFPGVAFPVATTSTTGVVSVGSGLAVSAGGKLSTVNNGTVTKVTTGEGLGAPASGDSITSEGTVKLLPPSLDGTKIGGVKAGDNVSIATDGTLSVPGTNFLASNNVYAYNSYIWPIPKAVPALPCPGDNGQVLTIVDNTTGQLGWTSAGGVGSVVGGVGITVATVSGTSTVSLATVPTVTAGTYGGQNLIPILQVNQYGQVTSAGTANPYGPFIDVQTTTPAIDLDFAANSLNWSATLQGNAVVNTPTNAQPGQRGTLIITQNPTTSYTLIWSTAWKFANSTPPSLSNALSSRNLFEFTVISANEIVVTNFVENFG